MDDLPVPFRSFDSADFCETASWRRVDRILTGTGGCYGLYGPRGAGKTWLMRMAVDQAEKNGGMGLWFPCPSEYDASDFLSALSDNLADLVERRFVRDNLRALVTERLRLLLSLVIFVPIAVAAVAYVIHGLGKAPSSGTVFSAIPGWLWLVVGIAIALFVVLFTAQIIWERTPTGQLVRDASALRERIRFTASKKLGSEVEVSGGRPFSGRIRRSEERAFDERPTTVASLVFGFRGLARDIVEKLNQPLVIGIDELDKIDRPESVLKLLRDIKGIFEISKVNFLVSVSEEAAAALQLGPLRSGRNEFNSSFYTVIEVPPLGSEQTLELLERRGIHVTERRAQLLCLLGAGNFREIVRMAEVADPPGPDADPGWRLLISALAEEATGLQREVISGSSEGRRDPVSAAAVAGAWTALPRAAFATVDAFVSLSRTAIHELWQPDWADDQWKKVVQESWRRLLIRLFVAGSVIAHEDRSAQDASAVRAMMSDLRDIVIMATHSATVARLMLEARFGDDLSSPYRSA